MYLLQHWSVWVSNTLEDVGVQDCHRLFGDTGIRIYLLPSQHWSVWVYKYTQRCHWQRSLRLPLPCWRYRYQDVPASALPFEFQMHLKMLLIKEFKIAIALLEILVSGCTCFRVSTDPFEFTNVLENVIDKGVPRSPSSCWRYWYQEPHLLFIEISSNFITHDA